MTPICFVTTSPLIVNAFLAPHLRHLSSRYAVSLAVTLPGEVSLRPLPGVEILSLPIRRPIAPLQDVLALRQLYALFTRRRFALVHSFAPKAGLLASWAGQAASVPKRVHTFTGQVWASRRGFMRQVLRATDRSTARAATHLLADSASQRDFLVGEGIVPDWKCRVLAHGSVSGVDTARFRPDAEARAAVRRELELDSDAQVIVYIGRITRDKGVIDLAKAFAGLSAQFPRAALLLVGHDEDALGQVLLSAAGEAAQKVRIVGYTAAPERYLAAANLLCLPSYREGFGTVVIEAAAVGMPAVASRIYGITDAVVEGKTGLLFRPGDSADLAAQLAALLKDEGLRAALGNTARERALGMFAESRLTAALAEFYRSLLAA